MTQTEDIEQVFRELLSAVERKDVTGLMEFFAEDAVTVDYSNPTVVMAGRVEIETYVREVFSMFSDMSCEVVSIVVSAPRIAAELVIRGTPARQAAPVELFCAGFYAFRKGKVVAEHIYLDAAQLPGGD